MKKFTKVIKHKMVVYKTIIIEILNEPDGSSTEQPKPSLRRQYSLDL